MLSISGKMSGLFLHPNPASHCKYFCFIGTFIELLNPFHLNCSPLLMNFLSYLSV